MASVNKKWCVAPRAPAELLTACNSLPSVVVQLLYNRHLLTPEAMERFLAADADEYGDPFTMKGVPQAVSRIRRAIADGERIAVYGDFDVDGITACALLCEALAAMGAQVRPYIPHRLDEGYGLNCEALGLLGSEGITLVISVDCGVGAVEQVRHASSLGVDVIVVDHHAITTELPAAVAVIDPKQEDCPYPHKELAAVGVTFKLVQGLLRSGVEAPALDERSLLDLVVLGTVADVVPLQGENRALVRAGLVVLNTTRRPGLRAMIRQAGLRLGGLEAGHIGWVLGPRLNAGGRIDSALDALHLLQTNSPVEAEELAERLEQMNVARQRLTLSVLEDARGQIAETGEDRRLWLLSGESWPVGVVGLVAGRLADELHRPVLAVSRDGVQSRGSARSIAGFDIVSALARCGDLLARYGGHSQAAGFTVDTANLDELNRRLCQMAAETLAGEQLQPVLRIDCEVRLSDLTRATWDWLQRMKPFGFGNPTPVFLCRGLKTLEARAVGKERNHLKLRLFDGRHVMAGIAFGMGERAPLLAGQRLADVVFRLELNEWNGAQSLEMHIEDLLPV